MADHKAHVILFGNEKGGSGKTTAAFHSAIGLLRLGFTVATIDLDINQKSLTRYLENRKKHCENKGVWLPMPTHTCLVNSAFDSMEEAKRDMSQQLESQIEAFRDSYDFIIMDTPGADVHVSRIGHTFADSLVTPMNDSFIDLDLLVEVDDGPIEECKPNHYARIVMTQRQKRFERDRAGMDWIVLRNRLGNSRSRNTARILDALAILSNKMGFRIAPGISERAIYRELFPTGRTVLDMIESKMPGERVSLSHIAARQEIREILRTLWLPRVTKRLD
ncbi:division plane positioning ATPase MipZ, partial [Curvivirga aplysinae]|uniref:division plane positioning ATPase MipZ n=1 Tax=Curvivirga aplysinae TaxID=2529852 RepID=UPI0012BC5AC4